MDQILEKERDEIEKAQKEVDMLDSDNEDLTEEQLDELEAQVLWNWIHPRNIDSFSLTKQ